MWNHLGPTSGPLGPNLAQLGPNLVPTWAQHGPKTPVGSGDADPFFGPRCGQIFLEFRKAPQEPAKPPQEPLRPPKNWFSMIFGRFLSDFWLIFLRCCSFFDQMLMDFRSTFCSCSVHVLLCCWCFGLLACCFVGLLTHRTSTKGTHQLT